MQGQVRVHLSFCQARPSMHSAHLAHPPINPITYLCKATARYLLTYLLTNSPANSWASSRASPIPLYPVAAGLVWSRLVSLIGSGLLCCAVQYCVLSTPLSALHSLSTYHLLSLKSLSCWIHRRLPQLASHLGHCRPVSAPSSPLFRPYSSLLRRHIPIHLHRTPKPPSLDPRSALPLCDLIAETLAPSAGSAAPSCSTSVYFAPVVSSTTDPCATLNFPVTLLRRLCNVLQPPLFPSGCTHITPFCETCLHSHIHAHTPLRPPSTEPQGTIWIPPTTKQEAISA